jgi:hypothetical protein
MACLASPCSYTLTITDKGSKLWENYLDLSYSLTYDEDTGIFRFEYSDASQDTDTIILKVYKDMGSSSALLCESNTTGWTGVVVCDVSGYSGKLRAVASRIASPETPIIIKIIDTNLGAFSGTMGLFISLIIMMVMVLIGVASPVLSIIMGILAFIPLIIFGIVPWYIFMIVVVMGFIVIHFMRRNNYG